jgi:hypothetical protein
VRDRLNARRNSAIGASAHEVTRELNWLRKREDHDSTLYRNRNRLQWVLRELLRASTNMNSTAARLSARADAKNMQIATGVHWFYVLLGALGVLGGSIY